MIQKVLCFGAQRRYNVGLAHDGEVHFNHLSYLEDNTMNKSRIYALGIVAAAFPGIAGAQTTFDFTGQTINHFGIAGDLSNTTIPNAGVTAADYIMGPSITIQAGTLNSIAPNTWPLEARVRLRNAAVPTWVLDFRLSNHVRPFTTLALPVGARVTPSVMTTPVWDRYLITPTDSWSVEFYDSTDDDTLGPDQSVTDLKFQLDPAPPVAFKIDMPGPFNVVDAANDIDNVVANIGVLPATNNAAQILIETASYQSVATNDTNVQSFMRFRNASTHLGLVYDVNPTAGAAVTNTTASINYDQYFIFPLGSTNNLRIPSPASGDTTVEFYSSTDNATNSVDGILSNIKLKVLDWDITLSPVTQPTATDLGFISAETAPTSNPLTVNTGGLGGAPKWYQFSIGNVNRTPGDFLDIWTETSAGAPTENPMMALYRANGVAVLVDNDDSNNNDAAFSLGNSTSVRPAIGNGVAFNGRDAAFLDRGTYYLAVCDQPTLIGTQGFAVFSGTNAGAFTTATKTTVNVPLVASATGFDVKFQSNGVGGRRVTATLDMPSISTPLDTELVTWEALNSSGTIIARGATRPDASGNVSFWVDNNYTGAGTVRLKVNTSLRTTTATTFSSSSVSALGTVSPVNGNTDLDSEIGPGDLQAILDNFELTSASELYTLQVDLDNDGEVGPGDLQIVLDNLGTEE
jgi:hypothetical protein